jgi:hypothetical protein
MRHEQEAIYIGLGTGCIRGPDRRVGLSHARALSLDWAPAVGDRVCRARGLPSQFGLSWLRVAGSRRRLSSGHALGRHSLVRAESEPAIAAGQVSVKAFSPRKTAPYELVIVALARLQPGLGAKQIAD